MSYTLSGGRIDQPKTTSYARLLYSVLILTIFWIRSIQCQLCSTNLDRLSVSQREQHYDKHFSDEPTGTIHACSVPGIISLSTQLPARPTRNRTAPRNRATAIPSRVRRSSTGRTGLCPKDRIRSGILPRTRNRRPTISQVTSLPALSEAPLTVAPGLIPLLKTHLNKSHAGGNIRRAVLCYDRTVLVTREVWDAGWGCGFASFLVHECHPDHPAGIEIS
jgi:hypothetical protein